MEIVILILLLAVAGLLAVVLIKLSGSRDHGSALLVQQQLEALRGEVNQSLKNTADTLGGSLKSTQDTLFQSLKITTETVNQQLNNVTSQLTGVTQQLQNNTGQMGSRLDNAARVIQDVQGQLGELGKATQEIKELGQSVSKLEEMLKAPKLRGGLGELLLEDLLKQVLPANNYTMQYRFRSGQAVDAVVTTAGGMVPVDSKFPLENFQKMVEAKTEQDKKTALRLFRTDVKKHIDAISGGGFVWFHFPLFFMQEDSARKAFRQALDDLGVFETAPESFPKGDLDHNGQRDFPDIAYLINYIFAGIPFPLFDPSEADLNCDGQPTAADIVLLLWDVFANRPLPCN